MLRAFQPCHGFPSTQRARAFPVVSRKAVLSLNFYPPLDPNKKLWSSNQPKKKTPSLKSTFFHFNKKNDGILNICHRIFPPTPSPLRQKKNNIHPSFTGFQRLCSRTPSRSYFSISSTSSWRYSFHCRGSSCVAPLNGWNLTLINFNKHLQTQRSNCGEEKKRHVS